ncbi:DUF1133 family protein [Pantoea osteomyelitidis]|uniref:DUF1133 family protein n=1 Tax=Pantoea osteomyelitidis TaxID=3230026 RepID=A0ABW7PV67_9GAMM
MIYPSTCGKADGKEIRLRTLESVWIQGKLRMWGRWSYIGEGKTGNVFNQLLSTKKVTKTALAQAQKYLKNSGLSKSELALYLSDLLSARQKSSLAYCTDAEALLIDRVISGVLEEHRGLLYIIHDRYIGRGKSKKQMARELNENHPEWCLRTCESRIDTWLTFAEYLLYQPMCEAFGVNVKRFR